MVKSPPLVILLISSSPISNVSAPVKSVAVKSSSSISLNNPAKSAPSIPLPVNVLAPIKSM